MLVVACSRTGQVEFIPSYGSNAWKGGHCEDSAQQLAWPRILRYCAITISAKLAPKLYTLKTAFLFWLSRQGRLATLNLQSLAYVSALIDRHRATKI